MITEITLKTQLQDTNLLRMGEAFFTEAGLPGRFIADKFTSTWENILAIGVGTIFFAHVDDIVVGAIGCLVHPDPYDGQLVAQEMFWFMTEEARGGFTALKLYHAFEAWAKGRGARRISMAAVFMPDQQKTLGVVQLYRKMGFRSVDISYFKEI